MGPDRRTVLRAGATLGTAAAAGCLGSLTDSTESVVLCEASVTNADDEDHVVSLRIHDGEETVYEDSVELRAVDRRGIDHVTITGEDLLDGGRATRLEARLGGEEWTEVDLESAGDPAVVQVAVRSDPVELEFVNPVGDESDCPH